jgi:hypothetical protein
MKTKQQQVAFLSDWDKPTIIDRAKYVMARGAEMVKRHTARVRQLTVNDFSKREKW